MEDCRAGKKALFRKQVCSGLFYSYWILERKQDEVFSLKNHQEEKHLKRQNPESLGSSYSE